MSHVEHQASVGNLCKHLFMLAHEAYVWMKVVTSFNSCASDARCRRGFEKVNVALFGIIPNQSCTRAKNAVV